MAKNDSYYNSTPTLDDRVHVLVSVIPANSSPLLSDKVMKKMREVRLAASDLGKSRHYNGYALCGLMASYRVLCIKIKTKQQLKQS